MKSNSSARAEIIDKSFDWFQVAREAMCSIVGSRSVRLLAHLMIQKEDVAMLKTFLRRVVSSGFLATVVWSSVAAVASQGVCGRAIYYDPDLNVFIEDGCEGNCPNGWACVELNGVKQPNKDIWTYCGCDAGELTPVQPCSEILVDTAAGGQTVECFAGGCDKDCYQWYQEWGNGLFRVWCECP
ncbi:MAG: hypothetical protein R3F29_04670 [Planctomycetota bacterium]